MAKILIVEDDKKLREELKIFLEKHGYEAVILEKFDNTIAELLAVSYTHLTLPTTSRV